MLEESIVYPGFYHVPHNDGIVINKLGVVTIKSTGHQPSWRLSKNGGQYVVDFPNTGKLSQAAISRLLALTFISIPDHLKESTNLLVAHKDDDKANLSLRNLYWTSRSELEEKRYQQKCNEYISRNPLPKFDEVNNGLYPNAIECPEKPGFFLREYPNYWRDI